MRKIIVAATIIALIITGSYGFFGYLTKNSFTSAIDQLNSQTPNHIDLTYKQGFLSSSVTLNSTIPLADGKSNIEITTSHMIYHGPFIFQTMNGDKPPYIPVQAYTEGDLSYELTGAIDPKLAQNIKKATAVKINGYIPLIGNAKIAITGEPLSNEFIIEDKAITFDWQGFTGSLEMRGSMKDFAYDFIAPGITLTSNGIKQFTMSGMTSSGSGRSGNFNLSLGDYQVGFKNITLIPLAEPGDKVILEDMNITLIADEKDGLVNASEMLDLAAFTFKNKTYGPINITVDLKNIDAKTLSTMNQELLEIQQAQIMDPGVLQSRLVQMITVHGTTLLSRSPEVEISNISIKTTKGSGELKLNIRFNGNGDVIMNPLFLMGRLEVNASFAADEQFLAQLTKELIQESICDDDTDTTCQQQAEENSREQLQTLVTNNQLILKNGRYVSSLSFKDGAATLNNKPIPLL